MNHAFKKEVCAPIRAHLGRSIRLPSAGRWHVTSQHGAPLLALELPHPALASNIQDNPAASPFFLVCFAWWHARLTGTEPALQVDIVGPPPTEPSLLRHARRAAIALEALQQALGNRLTITGQLADPWPTSPVFNARVGAMITGERGQEHLTEVQLTEEPAHAQALPAQDVHIDRFRRQLPLGMFDAVVSKDAAWIPGGKAQADLWAASSDGATFHLFELKTRNTRRKPNAKVGILSELFAYLWLVHRARVGLADGTPLTGGGDGLEAARRAERFVAWTLAPELHPLLGDATSTPLTWLAEGLHGHVDLGMLFFNDVGGARPFGGWRPASTWRSWACG